jgi:hypothetical protein
MLAPPPYIPGKAEGSLCNPVQLQSVTTRASPTAIPSPSRATGTAFELTPAPAVAKEADAVTHNSAAREATDVPADSFQHKISEPLCTFL